MELLNILFKTHVDTTKTRPFTHIVEFDKNKFNCEKYNIIKLTTGFDEFVSHCYNLYLSNNPDHIKGSLDINPKIWTKFAVLAIVKAYNHNLPQIVFPNGCCTKDTCPLNVYYEVVLNELTIKN